MTRVLHVIGTSEVGGTELFLLRLLRAIDSSRFRSAVCVLDAPGTLAGRYAAAADDLWHLRAGGSSWWRAISRWRRILRQERPDVLVLYGARANLLGRLAGRAIPVVSALRSTFVDEHGTQAAAWLDRITFCRVHVCVSNSRAAVERLRQRGYPAARLAYVPNGVDLSDFGAISRTAARQHYGTDPSRPVVACVANLKRVKAHDVLLDASRRLKSDGVDHELWLIGDGPERRQLEQRVSVLDLQSTVRFLGTIPDVPQRLAAADMAVLASRWEGMPTAVIEAMASGLPIVATRVGEVPSLVSDGVFGTLVAPDDADALAQALGELLRDRPRRELWGSRARQAAEEYSMASVIGQYERLFDWAAGDRAGAAPGLADFSGGKAIH